MDWKELVCLVLAVNAAASLSISKERLKRQSLNSQTRPNSPTVDSNLAAVQSRGDNNRLSNTGLESNSGRSGPDTQLGVGQSNRGNNPSFTRQGVNINSGISETRNTGSSARRRITKNKVTKSRASTDRGRPSPEQSSISRAEINAKNARLPRRSRTQIQKEFPWIEEPEGTDVSGRIQQDGRGRLYNPRAIRQRLRLADTYDLSPRFGARSPSGNYRVRMDQTWRGVRVYGSRLVAEQESTGLFLNDTIDGDFYSNIEDDLDSPDPTLSEAEAIAIAKAHNNDTETRTRKPRVRLFVSVQDEVAVLAYIVDYMVPAARSSNPRLDIPVRPIIRPRPVEQPRPVERAFNRSSRRNQIRNRINARISAQNGPESRSESSPEFLSLADVRSRRKLRNMREDDTEMRRPVVVLNANNGMVYRSWDGLATATTRLVNMRYGNPNSGFKVESTFALQDNADCFYEFPFSRSRKLRLNDKWDAQNSLMKKFTCEDAAKETYDSASTPVSARNSAWIWTLEAFSFMKNPSNLRINDGDVDIEVHHTGVYAAWDGNALLFGDGNSAIYPMTEPDIVAHEVGHIYTEYMSDLEYVGQSGSISESFSDMAAIAFVNHKFNTDSSNLKIGNSVSVSNRPLKDMCDPNSPLTLTYSTAYPYLEQVSDVSSYGGFTVHQGAGIYNKVFCYLVQNSGWSIRTTFKVFVDANMNYWTPQESFNSGVCGVRKAAQDLLGSTVSSVVDEAFLSVGAQCSE